MIALAAALAAPLLGVALYGAFHHRAGATRLVDGFVYLAVPVLVALQVLPQSWALREFWGLGAVAVGAGVYFVLERVSRSLASQADNLAILVSLSGLVLHAFLEGAALISAADRSDAFFVVAVVLHRLPIGLVVWWLIRPRHGRAAAATGVGAIVVATLAGFIGGGLMMASPGEGPGLEIYQAFVAGSLLHVVFHQGRSDHRHVSSS